MTFCNLNFNILKKDDLFLRDESLKHIVTANADIIRIANQNKDYYDVLKRAHLTFDGQVPAIVARLCSKQKIEKLSGSDIVYDFAHFAQRQDMSVFFLGGDQHCNDIARERIKDLYGIAIQGFSPAYENYPFCQNTNQRVLSEIARFKPDILFVGFGAPKQEMWLRDHYFELQKIGVKYAIGSGGTFDFLAGKYKRAPRVFQILGLEGIYRFFVQPSKMRFLRVLKSFMFFKYVFGRQDFINKE